MYSRSTLFLAAAIFTGSAVTAGAADVYQDEVGGSIKDNAIETILVPEAVEIPETMSWYLRGDFSHGWSTDVETGATIRLNGASAAGATDGSGGSSYGGGFGRYLSANTRLDFTFDYRNAEDTFRFDNYRFVDVSRTPVGDPGPSTFRYRVRDSDLATLASHTALANVYYDLARWHGLRPYVGAGLGFTIHELERRSAASASTADCVQTDSVGAITPGCGNNPSDASDVGFLNASGAEKVTGLGFAAALQAGLSYEFRDGVHLDTSYRATYSSGTVATTTGITDLESGNRTDHEVRIGFRYDIW